MHTISFQNFQYGTSIVIGLSVLLFVCLYKPKYGQIDIIRRALRDKFYSFTEISEEEFVDIEPNPRKSLYIQSVSKQILTFSINHHVDIRTIVYTIRKGLEAKKYKTISVVKSKSGWAISVKDKKNTYTIDIIAGLYVPHSFLIQVQKA